jgi:hypothetical protein
MGDWSHIQANNWKYELTAPMTYEQANAVCVFSDSFYRMHKIIDMFFHKYRLNYEDWCKLIGDWWSSCDFTSLHKNTLKYLLNAPTPEMMDEEELNVYNALPDTVTVYRGCGTKNKTGASWSLNKDVARKFPYFARYRADVPMLLTGRVKKADIVAVKLGRNEQEVISFNVRRIKTEVLPKPSPNEWFPVFETLAA